jgi:16S rRNA (guanine966-N2)-methyltransferase
MMNKDKKLRLKQSIKSKKPHTQTGSIRIIGGIYRGRKLPVLMAEGLRPTTDRVKETVFNWLMHIQDTRCLDCFAGSGSLGFEALSRGAAGVTLIELNKNAAKQLQQNQALLKADNLVIKQSDCLTYLQQRETVNSQAFDVVFLDPPFRKGLAEQAAILLNKGWLAEEAIIYVEMEANDNQQTMPANWSLLKEKTAGQVVYRLYQYFK